MNTQKYSLNGVSDAEIAAFREVWKRLPTAEAEREAACVAFGLLNDDVPQP